MKMIKILAVLAMGLYASTALADAKKDEIFKSIDDAFVVQKYGTADKLLGTITPEEAIVRLTNHASTGDIPAMWMLAKQYNRMGEGYRQDMANWTYSAVLGTRAYLNTCTDKEQIKAAEYKIIKTYSDEIHGARLYQDIRDKAIDYAIDFYSKNSSSFEFKNPMWVCGMLRKVDGEYFKTENINYLFKDEVERFKDPTKDLKKD